MRNNIPFKNFNNENANTNVLTDYLIFMAFSYVPSLERFQRNLPLFLHLKYH